MNLFQNNLINFFEKKIIRSKFSFFLFFMVRFFNSLVPKNENQILFSSIPDYSDNAKAYYDYLLNKKIINEYKLIWIFLDKNFQIDEKDINTYFFYSLNGIKSILRSKIIIVTHNNFASIKSKNQLYVNLWHGMPLKSMGYLDTAFESNESLKRLKIGSNAIDILIATSILTKLSLASSFNIDPRKIFITGQPRNDKLFLKIDNKKLLSFFCFDITKFNKIIIYIPTFRKFKDHIEGDCDYLQFLLSEVFHSFLSKNNILLLVKIHPLEERITDIKSDIMNFPNYFFINSYQLSENSIDFYNILNKVDILITDYSSIYFDFLLLNKPIIFYIPDIGLYTGKRGFLLEPYNFWTPGPKVTDINHLIEEIKKYIREDNYYEKERQMINMLINKYQDPNSSKRLYELIKQFKK